MNGLQIKHLTKYFDGVTAVDALSLEFFPGTITGIIGPNGSGKSTLVNLMTGMMPSSSGLIVVNKKEKSSLHADEIATLGITRTFQDTRLFQQLTVLDNILITLTRRDIFASLFEMKQKKQLKKAEDVLTRVGLWEKRDEKASHLSYGQRKLLEIGRALAMDANIYFFDEPFAGLSSQMIETIASILLELKAANKIIILVEHNMEIIRRLSDQCVVMDVGKVIAQGLPKKILAQKNVLEAYLGE